MGSVSAAKVPWSIVRKIDQEKDCGKVIAVFERPRHKGIKRYFVAVSLAFFIEAQKLIARDVAR